MANFDCFVLLCTVAFKCFMFKNSNLEKILKSQIKFVIAPLENSNFVIFKNFLSFLGHFRAENQLLQKLNFQTDSATLPQCEWVPKKQD